MSTVLRRVLGLFTCGALWLAGGLGIAAEIQPRFIRFGHLNNVDHPVSLGVKKFAELLAQKSHGKLVVQEFGASLLGNELEQQAALQAGTQEMAAPATSSLAAIVKEFGILDLPFSITSYEEADALLDGPLGRALRMRLREKGLVALGFWDLGFRNMTSNLRPIVTAGDFSGQKIRVIPNAVFVETFRALGAEPIPLPFSRLYDALATRRVDAEENPYSVIASNKLNQAQKYLSATNHVYAANIILVGKRFWDRLTPTERQLMQEAMDESCHYQRTLSRQIAQISLAQLKRSGMQFNEFSPGELSKVRAQLQPLIDKTLEQYDPVITSLYGRELARVRKGTAQ